MKDARGNRTPLSQLCEGRVRHQTDAGISGLGGASRQNRLPPSPFFSKPTKKPLARNGCHVGLAIQYKGSLWYRCLLGA